MTSVLVVDDDQTVRETLADYFETLGYVVRTAGTATAGRQAAAEHAPDVVLVDLRLPDASGLTLLEALRADDSELGVIVLTGHADVPTAVRAMQQGALDFLFFFFNDTATTEIYTLSLHDALPIFGPVVGRDQQHCRLRRHLTIRD